MGNKRLQLGWLLKMAWRDSRKNRSRLFLFISSMILGIAALVAIFALGDNLNRDIDSQAATLIGADLDLSSNRESTPAAKFIIDSLKKEASAVSEEQRFASMILFTKTGGTRLVQLRALRGAYPFYGVMETSPASAAADFYTGKGVLVDQTLMLQFKASVGDTVQLGTLKFAIAGILNQAPGQSGFASTIAPAVFMPLDAIAKSGLSQKGSRINYHYYYKFNSGFNTDELVKRLETRLDKRDLDAETISSKKESTGKSFADVTKFLSLVGFIALLLGCIGVASAVHIYVKEKVKSIAILRCLGLSSKQAFLIYLIQIVCIGFLGAVAGAVLGTLIQQLLPVLFQDLLPIKMSTLISWRAIGQGLILGICIAFLFSLSSLISIRKVSPLNTLRAVTPEGSQAKDPLTWFVYLLILAFITCFARLQLSNWLQTFVFSAAIVISFAFLYGISALVIKLIRIYFPYSWKYTWRQGLSNLYRPNNQTTILVLSVGLGTAFICTLFFVQSMLTSRITRSTDPTQPNMILFDIQSTQKDAITKLTKSNGFPILQDVPIVTMRLQEINGFSAADVRKDSSSKYSPRAFNAELRVTFRDSLTAAEQLISGKFQTRINQARDTARISLEESYARQIHAGLGDKLLFNVQGMLIPTIVGSIRKVDWNRVQTNFRLVFPLGVIDDAPQFHVLVTRVPDANASAAFQQKIVSGFPNVSIIDLALILSVVDGILDKIGFVIRFMAGFSIITGLIVLISSVMISKYQRIQESVLLRTLGASRGQVFAITALEYFFLGAIASLTGIVIALAGNWALARFSFEIPFQPNWLAVALIFLSISGLTMLIGILNSRTVLSKPPLEILRKNS
ncbi:ABC transporter permease [Pedobacter duraquae]|uniref:ABC transporter permease n=1 Tax=Pedobacter duraquae TaxID=425511 RepID=UPI0010621649|nr:FtsX-like permease family protein [Pedobacter duraquae]